MFLEPVALDGTLTGGPFDGRFAKEADPDITADLDARGLLLDSATIHHTYPFCWRCDTPVLYYAKPSWYIRTTAVRDALVANNQDIHWVPNHIRDGRFGEWLDGNVDWALSRERYWGTPLPFWVCSGCRREDCIGSYAELAERAGLDAPPPDPHRPFIDDVVLPCPDCGGEMRRTPEVADAWFDSGAMPYAQYHYPFENAETFEERFPADFICEAVDQTRGWFYTLHALATLLHHTGDVSAGVSYRNVICLGLIEDAEGQKMSKSRGNIVDHWEVLDAYGADALRWTMYTAAPPGNSRRFSPEIVREAQRRVLSTLWNTYSFFVTYANIAGFDPASAPPPEARTELDRWARSELHQTVRRVTEALEDYEPLEGARPIADFIEQLSNWYVRRSRRRFWKSDDSADTQAALHTLYECLTTLSKLIAPFTPFLAEALYRNLEAGQRADAPDSVHLAAWPEANADAIDEQLSRDVALVQRMVSLGRGARSRAGIKVRQPLGSAVLIPRSAAELTALERLAPQVADELNVQRVEAVADAGERLVYSLRPNLPALGPRYGREVGRIRAAIADADPGALVATMRAEGSLHLDGFDLSASDVLVDVEAAEGWSAAEDAGYSALVETTLTPGAGRRGHRARRGAAAAGPAPRGRPRHHRPHPRPLRGRRRPARRPRRPRRVRRGRDARPLAGARGRRHAGRRGDDRSEHRGAGRAAGALAGIAARQRLVLGWRDALGRLHERLDRADVDRRACDVEVVHALEVQPELRRHPQGASDAQGRVGGDSSAAVDDVVDTDRRDADSLRQPVLADAELVQDLGKVLAGVDRYGRRRHARSLVVVRDFNLHRGLVGPDEADAPLIVVNEYR